MSVVVEDLGKNMSKLVVTVEADKLEKAINKAYNRQKSQISMPGFRKGKVPRYLIEKTYGPEVFYEEASNILIRDEYPSAYDECGLDIVSQPEIEIAQVEKGKDFVFEATVAIRPDVELGEYKGVSVTKVDVEVTDDDVEERIKAELEKNGRTITVDREAANGDVVKIDFVGYMDGEPFDNGTGENFDLELGSHSFVGTFEEQLVGSKAGDEVEVNVTFPEDYQAEDLAGKDALFKVSVKEVKTTQLPELDDEFVQDVDAECETVDDYRSKIRAELEKSRQQEGRRAEEDEVVAKIVDDSKMEIPDAMVDAHIDQMMREFAQSLAMQGMNFEQYMQFTGMTTDKFKAQARPEAVKRISTSLVLEKIVDVEHIEVSDEEFEDKLGEMAGDYGIDVEELKKMMPDEEKDNVKKDVAVGKAVDFIMDNAKESKAKKSAKKASKTKADETKADDEKTE